MSQFKCGHCDLPLRTLCETVDHNIITHPTEKLRVKRYRRRGSYNGWQTTNFPGWFPHNKKMAYTPSKDQALYESLPSLIRVFIAHVKKANH